MLSHEVRKIDGNSSVYRLPITAAHVPNVYVTVTLFSPPDAPGKPADFKVGILPLAVAPDPQSLQDRADAATRAQAEPGQQVSYDVLVTDLSGQPVAAELSLDLVDKAVLSLLPRTPDAIREAFYHRRELGITTASGLSLSAERFQQQFEKDLERQRRERGQARQRSRPALRRRHGEAAATATAAAAAEARPRRRHRDRARLPTKARRTGPDLTIREQFSDTAYWNANVTTDAAGKASVQVKLPDNLTTWVMRGVGLTADTRVGEGTVEIVATKPLLIRPVTPRFFVVGDTAELSANVSNHTDSALDVQVGLATRGLTITGQLTQTVQVPANGEASVDLAGAGAGCDLGRPGVHRRLGPVWRRQPAAPGDRAGGHAAGLPLQRARGGRHGRAARGRRLAHRGDRPAAERRPAQRRADRAARPIAGGRHARWAGLPGAFRLRVYRADRLALPAECADRAGAQEAGHRQRRAGGAPAGAGGRRAEQALQPAASAMAAGAGGSTSAEQPAYQRLCRVRAGARQGERLHRARRCARARAGLSEQPAGRDWPQGLRLADRRGQPAGLAAVRAGRGRAAPTATRIDDLYGSREKLGIYARAFLAMAMQKAGAQPGDAQAQDAALGSQQRRDPERHRRALGGGRVRLVEHEHRHAHHRDRAGRAGAARPGATSSTRMSCAG